MDGVIEKVNTWIDEHTEDLNAFLCDLIAIKSENPWFSNYMEKPMESDVQECIAAFLDPLGFTSTIWEPDWKDLAKYEGRPGFFKGRDFKERSVLYSELKGQGQGKSILLTGHVDVVPTSDGWKHEAYNPTIEGGKIFGRGTVDMKGGIASMLMAVKAVITSGLRLKGDVKVGTVPDEEAGGMGSLAFIDKGYSADGCFMTEPTNLNIAPLCRGILWGKIKVPGRAGHIEIKTGDWRKGGGVDAIEYARIILNAISDLNMEWRNSDVKNHKYIPSPCQVRVAQINGGKYPTTYADSCEIVFDLQYLPHERDAYNLGGDVKKEFEKFIANIAANHSWLVAHPPVVEWLLDADCAEIPVDGEFCSTVVSSARSIGLDSMIEGNESHTDMGWFVNSGTPTINFGAGDPNLCHQDDEYVKVAELVKATKVIAATIIQWCGVADVQ